MTAAPQIRTAEPEAINLISAPEDRVLVTLELLVNERSRIRWSITQNGHETRHYPCIVTTPSIFVRQSGRRSGNETCSASLTGLMQYVVDPLEGIRALGGEIYEVGYQRAPGFFYLKVMKPGCKAEYTPIHGTYHPDIFCLTEDGRMYACWARQSRD